MKLQIKALGQTIEHEGEVVIALNVEDYPPDCMVLFVDMETWRQIKDEVHYEGHRDKSMP